MPPTEGSAQLRPAGKGWARARLLLGAVLISFSAVLVRLVSVPATVSAFHRVFIGGTLLALWYAGTRPRPRLGGRARYLAGAGLFFALDLWFWHRSIAALGPGLSTLLGNFQVFVMMAAGLWLGQRPTRRQLGGVPLAILGLALVLVPADGALTPDVGIGLLFGLLTAVSYGGYLLSLRAARIGARHAVPVPEVAFASLWAAACLAGSAWIEGEALWSIPSADLPWLIAYGLGCHAGGAMLITSSLTQVSTTEAGMALLLQPALSFVWDVWFFDRAMGLLPLAGLTLALCALFFAATGGRPSTARARTTPPLTVSPPAPK